MNPTTSGAVPSMRCKSPSLSRASIRLTVARCAGVGATLFALALGGCTEKPRDCRAARVCAESDRAAENAAIIACAAAANPKSDEEGEDLVAECRRTMRDSLCLRWEWFIETKPGGGGDWQWERSRLCSLAPADQQLLCRNQGWQP